MRATQLDGVMVSWRQAGVAMLLLGLTACDESAPPAEAQGAPPPPAVTVAEAVRRAIDDSAEFVGRVEAVDTVDLRARVTGFLREQRFAEGQEVRAGDLLFVIEKAPFEAAADQARADVVGAEADAINAREQLERARDLADNRNIPEATVDDRVARTRAAEAELLRARAALRVAEINLGYTEIAAPINGRIGEAALSVGNLVGPDRGILATIVSQDPVQVRFPVSSRQILNARQEAGATGLDARSFVVRARLPDGSLYAEPGRVDFLDIRVDRGTDTRIVRAVFPNPSRFLVDGQFVNIRVELTDPEVALVVPQAALQFTRDGASVLIVDASDKVAQRRVTTGALVGRDVVIAEGIAAGDRVIIQGMQSVRPGQTVAPASTAPQG